MEDVVTYYGVAVSREGAAEVHDSLARAERAANVDAHLVKTIYALAYQLTSAQRLAEAHRYLLLVTLWAPTNTDYLRALGRVQQLRGQTGEALNTFSMCVAFGDRSPEIGLLIAECLLANGHRIQAAAVLHEAEATCDEMAGDRVLRDRIRATAQLIEATQTP